MQMEIIFKEETCGSRDLSEVALTFDACLARGFFFCEGCRGIVPACRLVSFQPSSLFLSEHPV